MGGGPPAGGGGGGVWLMIKPRFCDEERRAEGPHFAILSAGIAKWVQGLNTNRLTIHRVSHGRQ